MENRSRGISKKRPKYYKPAIALYGNVAIEKGYCPNCHTNSFIRHGCFVCCDTPPFLQNQKNTSARQKLPYDVKHPQKQKKIEFSKSKKIDVFIVEYLLILLDSATGNRK
jgi:hypothetical protein